MKHVDISPQNVDNVMYDLWHKAADKNGTVIAHIILAPLEWYVGTGRISTDHLKILVQTNSRQRTTIINRLSRGGDDESLIKSVVEYLDKIGGKYEYLYQ